MSTGRLKRKPLSFDRSVTAGSPMPPEELRSAEHTLARLVAAAFAADHPELFGDKRRDVHIMGSRPETPASSFSEASDQGITAARRNSCSHRVA